MITHSTLFGEKVYSNRAFSIVQEYAEGVKSYEELVDAILEGEVDKGEDKLAVAIWIAKKSTSIDRILREHWSNFPKRP